MIRLLGISNFSRPKNNTVEHTETWDSTEHELTEYKSMNP